jgi:RHS repeat-associated protein
MREHSNFWGYALVNCTESPSLSSGSEAHRYRARLGGTYYRYLYNGERVLEELNDSGTMQARYTTESGSYYNTWLHLYRTSGTLSRFPMYDNIGSARGLLDATGAATDWYELDTFGRQVSSSGNTPNPYRFGGAWGYITDPSGFLQLGARCYWPEVGRFVGRDLFDGAPSQPDTFGRYLYEANNPVVSVDPTGYGIIALLRCFWCTGRILHWRHHCVTDPKHSAYCETWETDQTMGDRVRRMSQCIEQHTRPGYMAWCTEMCVKAWGTKVPDRPRI